MTPKATKRQVNLRLTDKARARLAELSEAKGISQADVIELLMRASDVEKLLRITHDRSE